MKGRPYWYDAGSNGNLSAPNATVKGCPICPTKQSAKLSGHLATKESASANPHTWGKNYRID